jgi:hypothetical protein
MPAQIPRQIKNTVIQRWLSGISREKIAKKFTIGSGTVSNIVCSARGQSGNFHDDFDLIRETALMMKREGLTIDNLVSIVRLEGFLKEMELKEGQIERMIDDLNAHLFKRGLSTEEYVAIINSLSIISTNLNIPLDKIFDSVSEKLRERDMLTDEIQELKRKKVAALHENATTSEILEEYKENRPLIEAYRTMKRRYYSRDRDCENLDSRLKDEIQERSKENSRWELNEDELENITLKQGVKSKTPKPIDPNHYTEMVQELLNFPLKYQDKIPGLMKHFYNLRDGHRQTLIVVNNVSA